MDGKLSIASHPKWLYFHNPVSAQKILRTRLNSRLGKLTVDVLDSSMKKMAAYSKAEGKKPGSTHDLLG